MFPSHGERARVRGYCHPEQSEGSLILLRFFGLRPQNDDMPIFFTLKASE